HRTEAFRGTALARRTPMTARVPRKNRHVAQSEHFDEFRPAPRVLVAAMKEKQRLRHWLRWNPGAIRQLRAVPARHRFFSGLHIVPPVVSPRRAVRPRWRRSRLFP